MMADHAGFIIAAYGITAVAVLGTLLWVLADHARLKRALLRFPARGDTMDGGA